MSSNLSKVLTLIKKALRFTRITKPNPRELLVANSPLLPVFLTLSVLGVFLLWYPLVLGISEIPSSLDSLVYQIQSKVSKNPFLWLFLLAPLLMIPHLLLWLRIIITGEIFRFDGYQGVLLKNDRPIVRFSEIQRIQRRTLFFSEQGFHSLALVLSNGTKVKIAQMGGEEEVAELADEIAKITNVEVDKSGFTLF